MPLRRNRRQYEQLTDFDRGRIIGLREAGWSNRRIGHHLGQERYGSCSVLATVDHRRQCRLDFCRPRATWSVTDWRRVIFSDESRFSLGADDHRTRVWRRTGQRSIRHLLSSGAFGIISQDEILSPYCATLTQQCAKDVTSYHGLPVTTDLSPMRACLGLGRQLQRSGKDTGELTAQVTRRYMAKGSSTKS
ncbi:HTH_Tnp_Tc3_2 domain-containing protein [Trichonephila clavipes]|nr:HTH_Tnp_Tc3_2 domain-containing protein [Trichonephila clavipes]